MEFYIIKRLPTQPSAGENWCDTFIGTNEKNAKADAVNSVMVDWFGERVDEGEEEETDNIDTIYNRYTSFWDDEEVWSIEKCVL